MDAFRKLEGKTADPQATLVTRLMNATSAQRAGRTPAPGAREYRVARGRHSPAPGYEPSLDAGEAYAMRQCMDSVSGMLSGEGRLVVLTYRGLEDRALNQPPRQENPGMRERVLSYFS